MSDEPKLCINCRHYVAYVPSMDDRSMCVISGELRIPCRAKRSENGKCGPKGKLYLIERRNIDRRQRK